MNNTANRRRLVLALAGIATMLAAAPVVASDHADPIQNDRLEGGITDLFVFPTRDDRRRVNGQAITIGDANQLCVVFCVRPALTASPPFPGLNEFTYSIQMDLHSPVDFDNELDRLRYGGTVRDHEAIDADFSITIRLDDDAKVREFSAQVKRGSEWKTLGRKVGDRWEVNPRGPFRLYSGVRDDPFIFPMFFGTNVIAMVMSLPLDWFPGNPQDFLVWGTSARHGVQIDHVGRSQRTQLPRFDLLNTRHPREHVAALREQDRDPNLKDDFLRTRIRPVFNLRPYDFKPDVMIFTRRKGHAASYPNGRQLEDDVAALTCQQGDCQLFELSFAIKDPERYKESDGRPTKNDKEFSDTFPYLADPWPDKAASPAPELTAKNRMLVVFLGAAGLAIVLLPWVLYFRAVRLLRTLRSSRTGANRAN